MVLYPYLHLFRETANAPLPFCLSCFKISRIGRRLSVLFTTMAFVTCFETEQDEKSPMVSFFCGGHCLANHILTTSVTDFQGELL